MSGSDSDNRGSKFNRKWQYKTHRVIVKVVTGKWDNVFTGRQPGDGNPDRGRRTMRVRSEGRRQAVGGADEDALVNRVYDERWTELFGGWACRRRTVLATGM